MSFSRTVAGAVFCVFCAGLVRAEDPSEKVVAQIGEVSITLHEIERELREMSPMIRSRYKNPEHLRALVEDRVRLELLAREAERKGYGERVRVVRAMDDDAIQTLVYREIDSKMTPESVPLEEVKLYYDSHRDRFSKAEMFRASSILLGTREQAEDVLAALRDVDARAFRYKAQEVSLDATNKFRGGDLGYFARDGKPSHPSYGVVPSSIAQAVFDTGGKSATGALVPQVIPVGAHWSVLKITGHRPAISRALTEVESEIRETLAKSIRMDKVNEMIEQLRKAKSYEFHPEGLDLVIFP